MTTHIVVEVLTRGLSRDPPERFRVLLGHVIAAVPVEDLPERERRDVPEGARLLLVMSWRGHETKDFWAFCALDDLANALDARTVSS